jgi:hypothetical protein
MITDYEPIRSGPRIAHRLDAVRRAMMEDRMYRPPRARRGEPDPVVAAWIVCLTIAALALVLSGIV